MKQELAQHFHAPSHPDRNAIKADRDSG